MGRLGAVLRLSWAVLGASWAVERPSWAVLGASWGPLGAMLEASWAVLECRQPENARTRKTLKNTMKINDFGFLGPPWKSSRNALGASWGLLGQSWGHLGLLGALLGCLGGFLPSPEAIVDASGGRKSVRDSEKGPRTPGAKFGYEGGGGSFEKVGGPGPRGPGRPLHYILSHFARYDLGR